MLPITPQIYKRRARDLNPDTLSGCRISSPVLYQLSQLCRFESFAFSLSRCSSNAHASMAFSSLLAQKNTAHLFIQGKRYAKTCLSILSDQPYLPGPVTILETQFSRLCLALNERMVSKLHSYPLSSADDSHSL